MSNRQPNQDLFEDTRMSFGQHIEELRVCLVRALYGLALASIIGFMYADHLVKFLQRPLEAAIREYDLEKAENDFVKKYGFMDPESKYRIETEKQAPRTVWISPEDLARINGRTFEARDERLFGLDIVPGKTLEIAQRLVQSTTNPNDSLKGELAIFKLLTSGEQETIRSLTTQSTFSRPDDLAIKKLLGRVAIESKLFMDPAFDKLTVEPEKGWFSFFSGSGKSLPFPQMKKQILEAENQAPSVSRNLNRALIHSVFFNELTPPRNELLSVVLWEEVPVETQSLTPHEPFMIWMKAGFFAALVIASPWILYQLWMFVSAGLYPHEKRYVHWYLPISVLLFFAGISLAFFFVLTPVLDFLFKFNATMGIKPQLRINYWLSFVMYLPLGFGVAFQLPLVMLVLNRLGIIEISVFLSKWRIAIMVIFVVSMLLTPADPLSMILLAVPLTLLYFFGIALCKWMPRNKNPFGESYEPA